jgi:hypothetical protein
MRAFRLALGGPFSLRNAKPPPTIMVAAHGLAKHSAGRGRGRVVLSRRNIFNGIGTI